MFLSGETGALSVSERLRTLYLGTKQLRYSRIEQLPYPLLWEILERACWKITSVDGAFHLCVAVHNVMAVLWLST